MLSEHADHSHDDGDCHQAVTGLIVEGGIDSLFPMDVHLQPCVHGDYTRLYWSTQFRLDSHHNTVLKRCSTK